jgi:hypothetical protein
LFLPGADIYYPPQNFKIKQTFIVAIPFSALTVAILVIVALEL